MEGEHLLRLVRRIRPDEPFGHPRLESVLFQVLLVVIRPVQRREIELESRQHTRPRKRISNEVFAGETHLTGTALAVDMPLAGVAAAVARVVEVLLHTLHVGIQHRVITGHPVPVWIHTGQD